MQIHDPEFCPSVDLLLEQTLPALQKLRRRKVRFVGMTGYPLAVQQEIISAAASASTRRLCAAQLAAQCGGAIRRNWRGSRCSATA